jgi:hypothetical protein
MPEEVRAGERPQRFLEAPQKAVRVTRELSLAWSRAVQPTSGADAGS